MVSRTFDVNISGTLDVDGKLPFFLCNATIEDNFGCFAFLHNFHMPKFSFKEILQVAWPVNVTQIVYKAVVEIHETHMSPWRRDI